MYNLISIYKNGRKNSIERKELETIKQGLTNCSRFNTKTYVQCIFNKKHQSAPARFRCGTVPKRLVLARYKALPVEECKCPFCMHDVANEVHVLTQYSLHNDIWNDLYD